MTEPLSLATLRAIDLERSGVSFTDGTFVYFTSGRRLGHGGMGNVWTLSRRPIAEPDAPPEMIVGKTFREEYLVLLGEGIRGLAVLHERGIVHRDFTLHNILTLGDHAAVFDFDLSVAPGMLASTDRSYQAYYQGRIAGSPEYSVAPELLDDVLGLEQ